MAVQMSVTFLGTGASWPTIQRGLSAIAVKRGGEILLWDCGEGTQRQIQQSGLSYQQISQIWLTHYHGDHCFGVPGLLKTMALNERDRPLTIYGPRGIERMAAAWRSMGGWPKEFPIEVREIAAGDQIELDGYTIEVHAGDHGIENLCLALQEHVRPGRFDKPKALALGVPEGRLFGRLQKGEDVVLEDGTEVRSSDVLGPTRQGRRVAFSGDTQPCLGVMEAAKGADLFICEASFMSDLRDRARDVRHMCADEAGAIAAKAAVKRLVITHISPRYKDASPVLAEAKAVFDAAELAEDLSTFEVPLP